MLKMIIRIANYPARFGPSAKPFCTIIVVHPFMAYIVSPVVKYV